MAEPTKSWKVFQEVFGANSIIVDSNGDITFAGDFATTGDHTITGDVTITGSFAVTGQSLLTGAVNIVGAVGINGDATLTAGKDVVLSKSSQAAFSKLQLAILNTTPTTSVITKGDLWLHKVTTDIYRLAMCISNGVGTVKRMRRADFDVSLGSAS